jgi:DNA-directed RNA polymerase subunit L
MSAPAIEVVRLDVERDEPDYSNPDVAAAFRAVIKSGAPRLPLAKTRLSFEVRGVPTAAANALRRVLAGEMVGRCLTFDRVDRAATSDPFMIDDDFLRTRIRMIPLAPQIPADVVAGLRLALSVANTTEDVVTVYSGDLVVTAGELPTAIFNPTFEIAFLQPGHTLRIADIHIAEGSAARDVAFAVAARATLRPLDVAELPREATHTADGAAATLSGFAESALVADPRHHRVACVVPAAPPDPATVAALAEDACFAVMKRLRYVQQVVEAAVDGGLDDAADAADARSHFVVTADAERTTGVLTVADETHTIGNLLSRYVYELVPDISFVAYTCIPHEKRMQLKVVHAVPEPGELGALVLRAVEHAYAVFTQIHRGIRKAARV